MGKLWTGMVMVSLVCAFVNGRMSELSASVMEGAAASCELCLSIAGMVMFWSGIMEVMRRSGLMEKLARLMRPAVGFIFPAAKAHPDIMGDICANISANLLGLGNAATPAGIRAAQGLQRINRSPLASEDMCMLVIVNTASLQLIPTTIGAIRAGCGAAAPFDIIPAVWLASVISMAAGILSAKILARAYRSKALSLPAFTGKRGAR